jgi:hypothetical protein
VEPIISLELWEKARDKAKIQAKVMPGAKPKYMYLMAQRLKCSCGRATTGRTSVLKHGFYHYYACGTRVDSTNKRAFDTRCDRPYFRVEWVDMAVWEWIDQLYREPDKLRERLKAQQRGANQSVLPFYEEMERLEQQIKTMERQLEEMIADQYKAEKPRSKAIFAKMIADTEQSIEEAENRLKDLHERVEPLALTDEHIDSIVGEASRMYKPSQVKDGDLVWVGILRGDELVVGIPR